MVGGIVSDIKPEETSILFTISGTGEESGQSAKTRSVIDENSN